MTTPAAWRPCWGPAGSPCRSTAPGGLRPPLVPEPRGTAPGGGPAADRMAYSPWGPLHLRGPLGRPWPGDTLLADNPRSPPSSAGPQPGDRARRPGSPRPLPRRPLHPHPGGGRQHGAHRLRPLRAAQHPGGRRAKAGARWACGGRHPSGPARPASRRRPWPPWPLARTSRWRPAIAPARTWPGAFRRPWARAFRIGGGHGARYLVRC